MSDDKLKRSIAFSGFMACTVSFLAGYVLGMLGWWFLIPIVGIVYFVILGRLNH